MPMATETVADGQTTRALTLSREPKGPKTASSAGSLGDQALMDAIVMLVAAWVLLILLGFSLRHSNI